MEVLESEIFHKTKIMLLGLMFLSWVAFLLNKTLKICYPQLVNR